LDSPGGVSPGHGTNNAHSTGRRRREKEGRAQGMMADTEGEGGVVVIRRGSGGAAAGGRSAAADWPRCTEKDRRQSTHCDLQTNKPLLAETHKGHGRAVDKPLSQSVQDNQLPFIFRKQSLFTRHRSRMDSPARIERPNVRWPCASCQTDGQLSARDISDMCMRIRIIALLVELSAHLWIRSINMLIKTSLPLSPSFYPLVFVMPHGYGGQP
jgi:hypothetical protein